MDPETGSTTVESYKAGNLGANSVDTEMGERIDLAVLPVRCRWALHLLLGCRSWTELLKSALLQTLKNWELGFKTPTLKFQNGDVQNFKFSVMDKLHKPLVAACKVVAAGNRIVLQPENQGGPFVEDVRSKRRERIFERNGVYVLPCWLVKQSRQKHLAPLDESYPNDRQVRP